MRLSLQGSLINVSRWHTSVLSCRRPSLARTGATSRRSEIGCAAGDHLQVVPAAARLETEAAMPGRGEEDHCIEVTQKPPGVVLEVAIGAMTAMLTAAGVGGVLAAAAV